MKNQEFKRKDGTTGWKLVAEDGDTFTSLRNRVGSKPATIIGGVVRNSNFLEIEYLGKYTTSFLNGKTEQKEGLLKGYLSVTEGQKKFLDKTPDLTNKQIRCGSYKNKYGEGQLKGLYPVELTPANNTKTAY